MRLTPIADSGPLCSRRRCSDSPRFAYHRPAIEGGTGVWILLVSPTQHGR
jgi:hypothetical protein